MLNRRDSIKAFGFAIFLPRKKWMSTQEVIDYIERDFLKGLSGKSNGFVKDFKGVKIFFKDDEKPNGKSIFVGYVCVIDVNIGWKTRIERYISTGEKFEILDALWKKAGYEKGYPYRKLDDFMDYDTKMLV